MKQAGGSNRYNILVNAIAPGRSSPASQAADAHPAVRRYHERVTPLKRMAVPGEIGARVPGISASSYITGTQLVIDANTALGFADWRILQSG